MRILIMSDMEGVAGISNWEQVTGGTPLYDEARRLYTQELNAAARGAVAVHDDDLGGPRVEGPARRRVDLLRVEPPALVVERRPARDLLPVRDAGHALHVAHDQDAHVAPTSGMWMPAA